MEKGNTFAGILAGIGIGALIGVLFAPEKGSETRKKIATKGKDTLDDVKNKYEETIEYLSSKLDDAKKQGFQILEDGTDLLNKATK